MMHKRQSKSRRGRSDMNQEDHEDTVGLIRSVDLAHQAGISYRMLDHWTRRGWIRPRGGHGSGFQRHFTPSETAVVCTAGQLVKLGIIPERAVQYARELESSNAQSVDLDGWTLVRTAPAGLAHTVPAG